MTMPNNSWHFAEACGHVVRILCQFCQTLYITLGKMVFKGGQKWHFPPIGLNITVIIYILMSNSQNATTAKAENNNNSSAAATNNNSNKKTETTKMVIMSFDKLDENSQMKVLERIAKEKNPEIDGQFLYQELTKNGISKIPSKELQEMALNARKEFAIGGLSLLRSQQLILGSYDKAIAEGFEPKQARTVVNILVTQNGRILSDRQTRRILSKHRPEAIDQSKVNKSLEEKKAQPKTPEQQEGLTGIYLPPAACQAIGKYGAKNQACMLYIKGKAYIKVKDAVVTEKVEKKNGQQVTTKVREPRK